MMGSKINTNNETKTEDIFLNTCSETLVTPGVLHTCSFLLVFTVNVVVDQPCEGDFVFVFVCRMVCSEVMCVSVDPAI